MVISADIFSRQEVRKLLVLQSKSGAQGENRTLTPLLAGDFESPASTVPPLGH